MDHTKTTETGKEEGKERRGNVDADGRIGTEIIA